MRPYILGAAALFLTVAHAARDIVLFGDSLSDNGQVRFYTSPLLGFVHQKPTPEGFTFISTAQWHGFHAPPGVSSY